VVAAAPSPDATTAQRTTATRYSDPRDDPPGGPLPAFDDAAVGSTLGLPTVAFAFGALLVVTVLAVRIADRLVDVAGLVAAAVALALLSAPLQRWLQRFVGTAASVTAVAVGTLVTTFGLGLATLADLRRQLGTLGDVVNARIDALAPGSLPQRLTASLRIQETIAEWTGEVPTAVVTGQDTSTAVGRQLMSLFFVVILAAFLQASGRTLVDHIVSRWPRDDLAPDGGERRAVRDFLSDVDGRGAGFARRTLLVGGAAAGVVAGAAALLQVPGALVLGLWAGAWCVVPSVGWFVACIPIVALAAIGHEPETVATALLTVAVCTAGALARRRSVEPGRVRLGASVHVAAVAIGVAVGGIAGTLVAVVLASIAAGATSSAHWPGWPRLHGDRRVGLPIGRTTRWVTVPSLGTTIGIGLAVACSVAFTLAVLGRLVPAIAWLLIGAFVAIALRRPADFLQRRGMGPYAARSVVLACLAAVVVASALAGADEGVQASSRVADRLPEVVEDLESAPLVGRWLTERDASTWVSEQIADAPQRLRTAEPGTWLPGVTARLVDLWWTAVIAAAFLFDGDRLVRGGLRRVPASRRRQATRLVEATGVALTGYAAGAALLATINATVVFTIAMVLGLGLAPVVAVWAFVWNFVPQIGGFMGGVPLVLFALVSGPAEALVASGLFLTYQLLENHVIQPAVIGAAIDVPPWGTLLAALAGGAAAGVLGAVLFTPLVGVVRVIRAELRRDDFPGSNLAVERPPREPRVAGQPGS
jgi:predicted PurR-regulated permease PerM